jgi:hypothetical protein
MENKTSFDLNAAIQRWRGELAKSSSFRADDLEELESHLRDSESSLRGRGLTGEEAFLIAVRRTGSGDVLAAEFATINGSSVWRDRLLWMTTGGITMSALSSLITTLLFVRTVFAWLAPAILAFALILGLQSNLVRKFLREPLRLATAFLLVSLSFVLLSTSLMDSRMLGPIANFPYMQRLLLSNVAFSLQFVACAGVIALFAFRIGIVSGRFLLKNMRWAIVISTISAAVITPTADIANMMVVAIPMVLLYLIGVVVAFVFGRQRRTTHA